MKVLHAIQSSGTPIAIRVDSIGYWEPVFSKTGESTQQTVVRFHAIPVGVVINMPYHEVTMALQDEVV